MSESVEKERLWWADVREAVKQIGVAAETMNVEFDHVVGVARGGLPLAVSLSHRLDVPMGAIWATHYDGTEQEENVVIENYGLAHVSEGDTILLVDDVSDSGETLNEISRMWDGQDVMDFEYRTAVWHEKPNTSHQANIVVEPDVETWIVYPWEQGGLNNE